MMTARRWSLFPLLAGLNIADYAITRRLILRDGLDVELNPLMRGAAHASIDDMLLVKVLVLVVFGVGIALARRPRELLIARLSLVGLNVIMAVIVAWGIVCLVH